MTFWSGTAHIYFLQLCQRLLVTRACACSQKGLIMSQKRPAVEWTSVMVHSSSILYSSVNACWLHASVCVLKKGHNKSPTAYIRMTFCSGTHLVNLQLCCWWHVQCQKNRILCQKRPTLTWCSAITQLTVSMCTCVSSCSLHLPLSKEPYDVSREPHDVSKETHA